MICHLGISIMSRLTARFADAEFSKYLKTRNHTDLVYVREFVIQ